MLKYLQSLSINVISGISRNNIKAQLEDFVPFKVPLFKDKKALTIINNIITELSIVDSQ